MSLYTRSLTTGLDALTGSAGNDNIGGVLAGSGTTGTTAAPGDVINGGAGTDTLTISVAGAITTNTAYTLSALQTTGVEKVLVSNFDTATGGSTEELNIIDASLMNGVETVGLAASSATGDTSFTGLKNIVDAEMRNGSSDLTVGYATGVTSGTADVQDLALSAVSGGTFTAAGVETVNITGSLTANTLTALTATSATKLNISGDQNFTLAGSTAIANIDASGNSGKTSLVLGNVTLGQTVTLGSGDDTVDIAGNLNYVDKLSGGEGDDLLKISGSGTFNGAASVSTSAEFLQVSGFETVDLASTGDAATLDLKYIADVTTARVAANSKIVTFTGDTANTAAEKIAFNLNGTAYETASVDFTSTTAATDAAAASAALTTKINTITGFSAVDGTGTVTVTNTSSGERVDLTITAGSANTFTEVTANYKDVTVSNITDQTVEVYTADLVTATLADTTGTSDSLTVALKTATADRSAAQTVTDINVGVGLETLNLSSTGMKGAVSGVSAAVVKTLSNISGDSALTTLNITGSDALTISDHGTDNTKLATINAADYTGDLTLSDTVASLGQKITTGSGNDTIVFGANLTSADSVDMGGNTTTYALTAGKDTLTADVANRGTANVAYKYDVSNVESLDLKLTTGASYIDGSGFKNIGAINLWNADGAPFNLQISDYDLSTTLSLGGTADQESKGTYTIVPADATGDADSLAISIGNIGTDDDVDADIVVSGVETITISRSSSESDNAVVDMTKAKASTIVVKGGDATAPAGVTDLDTLSTSTTTVSATSYYGLLKTTASAVGTNIAYIIGSAGNTVAGGAGNDTVTIAYDLNGDDVDGAGGIDTLNATMITSSTEASANFEVVNYTIGNSKQITVTGADGKGVDVATTFNLLGGNSQTTFVNNYVSPAALTTINLAGYTGATTQQTFAASQLVNTMTITGSAGVDTIIATTNNNNAAVASMSGIETLKVNVAGGASVFDFAKTTGITKLLVDDDGTARSFTATDLPDGVTIEVEHGVTGSTLVVDQLNKASTDNVQNITIKTTATDTHTYNIDADDIETINIKMSDASVLGLSGSTMTATGASSTLNLTGDKVATLATVNTDIKTINAEGMTTGGGVIQSARSTTSAVNYTGSVGDDTFIMMNAGDNLDGGLDGTDTLDINVAAILGGIQVDLSATGDQIVSMNGGNNTGTVQNFNNVELDGYTGSFGAVVTAAATGSKITGTANADQITLGDGVDTVVVAASAALNGADAVFSFTAGTDGVDMTAPTITAKADGTVADTTDTLLYYFVSAVAGDADSASAVATKATALGTFTAAAATAYILMTDNDSAAIYEWNDIAGVADEVNAAELTLIATFNTAITQADITV